MNKTFEALLGVGDYNGYIDEIEKIINYLKEHSKDEYIIAIPEFLTKDYHDPDNYIRVLWSVLVLEYGDYGTSPRFGWINVENSKKIISILQPWVKEKRYWDKVNGD